MDRSAGFPANRTGLGRPGSARRSTGAPLTEFCISLAIVFELALCLIAVGLRVR